MQIRISDFVKGAADAEGIAVIIDVFRAFSLEAYAVDRGVSKIIPVGDIEKAREIKGTHPEFILAGERHEKKPPDFDFGNSPSHIIEADLYGKTLIHTTSAGTQGLSNARNADVVLTGAFVNASAIVRYIQRVDPDKVTLVCMGYEASRKTEEDSFCAEYIHNMLTGKYADFGRMKRIIRKSSAKRFFLDEKQEYAPSSDFELCMELNRFNFVLKLNHDGDYPYLKRIDI